MRYLASSAVAVAAVLCLSLSQAEAKQKWPRALKPCADAVAGVPNPQAIAGASRICLNAVQNANDMAEADLAEEQQEELRKAYERCRNPFLKVNWTKVEAYQEAFERDCNRFGSLVLQWAY